MSKKVILILITCMPFISQAQSTYDSLRKVYHAQYVFEQREKGDSFKFIKEELSRIKNPETRQLAACAIASNIYGYGFVDNKKILGLVEDVISAPQSEYIRKVAQETKAELNRSLVGTKIMDISLPAPNGDIVNLVKIYSSGFDYVVVDLWATWCGPCIAEMKKFNDLKKHYNVEFYSISLDDDISKVQKFVKRNSDYTWSIVFSGKESSLWDYFKVRLIPAFVIVEKNGIVVSHIVGKGLEDQLQKLYKK